jgi:hypothetical protein
MWSLPSIDKINREAEERYDKEKNLTAKQILRGKKCDHDEKEKATIYYDWYDVFSDVPKGRIFLCDKHDGYYGNPDEGFFTCVACSRVFTENYTWEKYNYVTEDGEELCLNCYLDGELDNTENWINAVEDVSWEKVTKAKHLIPVEGRHWQEYLEFVGNVEFDSMTGAKLTGFSSTSSRDDGLNDLRDIVRKAKKPCMLILDGAYQFSVSLGVYTRK